MKASGPPLEQYEALRQHALGQQAVFSVDPLGTVLVLKTGVAGWMREWRQPSGEGAPPPLLPAPALSAEPDWQHELTLVLAQITTRHLSFSPS